MAEKRKQLHVQAIEKLSAAEASAIIAPAMAVALAYRSDPKVDSSSHGTDKVLQSLREIMARLNKPLKWLGADGTEYDTYREYLKGQWGADLPYPPGPFES